MGILSRFLRDRDRSTGRFIEPSMLARLPEIGRDAFSPNPQHFNVSDFYLPGLETIGYQTSGPAWESFLARFAAELSLGAEQHGGWASAGAFYVAKDLVNSDDWEKPSMIALMDHALQFLASQQVSSSLIPFFALTRYREMVGDDF